MTVFSYMYCMLIIYRFDILSQVKNQKRLVRVQELMSSEEEKKKIKQLKAVNLK